MIIKKYFTLLISGKKYPDWQENRAMHHARASSGTKNGHSMQRPVIRLPVAGKGSKVL
ncbi:hypothetical protein [Undibacterium oligocarboniphilum]|uniref:Uncharacterized protein n=1 Tax=Undibacterium oligocarboniphilum TaxID=666702 RepID=A0A850QJN1_9BURK|nr:hypothetical protein [Undibacterium oligocarboniphilum]MBC3870991.1 hypothetical protein [Undibacterium oligocarboniphilum]NVO76386.1 hypothetical protein [Undibacterium oligocarboniphilum]